jgi:asparagine synthetase B (glutamine-hydrolysing)
VLQVSETHQKILGDHIYVFPPDKFMAISGDFLRLVPRPAVLVNSAIDHFLFSLARDQADGSIGVILSGEGADGAKGGVTMAQTPATFAHSVDLYVRRSPRLPAASICISGAIQDCPHCLLSHPLAIQDCPPWL